MSARSHFAAIALAAALLVVPGLASGQAPSAPAGSRSQQAEGHAGHGSAHDAPDSTGGQDHAGHQPPDADPPHPPDLPPITDEDRAAAFPDLNGQHTVHDDGVRSFVLFDQLEWQSGGGVTGVRWDNEGWIGQDVSRFWFRTEGAAEEGRLGSAQVHALYGRAIARWWDLVVGLRQDVRPGPSRTWAVLGIQGLAPYWFEVEATAYLGESGRTHVRFETEYELLLTNRLVLQPLVEIDLYGKSDPERGLGAGLASADAALRLRYEVRRELAPYIGVTWSRKFSGTADLAEAAGERTSETRLALGVRVWF